MRSTALAVLAVALTSTSVAAFEFSHATSQRPRGFAYYCASEAGGRDSACGQGGMRRASLAMPTVKMDDERRRLLRQVNQAVNAALIYDDSRPDVWRAHLPLGGPRADGQIKLNPFKGACGDAQVTKLQMLLALGFPREAMRLTVVKAAMVPDHHLVLVVRTSDGDLVLDNEDDRVLPVQSSALGRYAWIAQEDPATGQWRYIQGRKPITDRRPAVPGTVSLAPAVLRSASTPDQGRPARRSREREPAAPVPAKMPIPKVETASLPPLPAMAAIAPAPVAPPPAASGRSRSGIITYEVPGSGIVHEIRRGEAPRAAHSSSTAAQILIEYPGFAISIGGGAPGS